MPNDDATFEALLCQQGFLFFPDKSKAIHEMYRVLAPSGRLGLSVWRSISYNPYFRAFSDALERHVNPEAETSVQNALLNDIVETLQPYTDDEGLAVPLEVHTVVAWK